MSSCNALEVASPPDRVDFWSAVRWFVILFVLAAFLDTCSTIHFMRQLEPYGPEYEINPLFQIASEAYGCFVGPLMCYIFKVIAGLWVAWKLGRWAPYMFITAIILSLWAAWYNVWGCDLEGYFPNIFTWAFWAY